MDHIMTEKKASPAVSMLVIVLGACLGWLILGAMYQGVFAVFSQ
jgi:hypothetical protein